MRRGYALSGRFTALTAVTALMTMSSLWAQNPGAGLPSDGNILPPTSDTVPPRLTIPIRGDLSPSPPSVTLPSPSSPIPGHLADPEAAANGFIERTTKEAEDAIKALTAEAEALKARLKKVEAGLERWREVKVALVANSRSGVTAGGAMRQVLPPKSVDNRAGEASRRVEPESRRQQSNGDEVPPPIIPDATTKK